jgi:hypothetical protein
MAVTTDDIGRAAGGAGYLHDSAVFDAAHAPGLPIPRIPPLGRDERYYARGARHAERDEDVYLRCAHKTVQYITLALNPTLEWEEKLKYFHHALERHCVPPPYPDDATWMFFRTLADLVRQHAGREALRLASREDDFFAARLAIGQRREVIEEEAERLFTRLVPQEQCPDYFNEEDFLQLKILRNQWIRVAAPLR